MKYKLYFLLKDGVIVYIGQTKSLQVRMPSHKEKEFDRLRWIDCDTREIVLMYEKRWIRRFKPKYNSILYRTDAFHKSKFTLDINEDFYKWIRSKADEHGIKSLGAYIKAVLRKATKYKERELV